jgi:hypothetical protein
MPPANDSFANATTLSGASGSLTFSNIGSTLETGEYHDSIGSGGPSVWFKWTPTAGDVFVKTSSTPLPTWDSMIEIVTGSGVLDMVEVTDADDNDFQPGSTEEFGTGKAIWTADGATTYYIQITYYDDVSGPPERSDLVLSWGVAPPPSITNVDPPGGPILTEVDIFGSGFSTVTTATINGVDQSWDEVDNFHGRIFIAAGTTDGYIVLHRPGGNLVSSDQFRVGDPPNISGLSPSTAQVVGRPLIIFGTDFNHYGTSVTIGGVPASFTVDSPTQITATVPLAASNNYGTVVVANLAGEDTRDLVFYYPGPWIQPPVQIAESDFSHATYQTVYVEDERSVGRPRGPLQSFGQGSIPDPSGAPIERVGFGASNLTGVWYEVGHMAYDPIEFAAAASFGIAALDLTPLITPDPPTPDPTDYDDYAFRYSYMSPVVPTSGDVLDAGADAYEFEMDDGSGSWERAPFPPGGYYEGGGWDIISTFFVDFSGATWSDDVNHKSDTDFTPDLFSAQQQVRRLPSSAYTTQSHFGLPTLIDETTWPADEVLSGDVIASHALIPPDTGFLQISPFSVPYNNVLVGFDEHDGDYKTTVHFDDMDLDEGNRIGFVYTFDRFCPDTTWFSPPYLYTGPSDSDPADPYQGGMDVETVFYGGGPWKNASDLGRVSISWQYRPPRYRFLYRAQQGLPNLDGMHGPIQSYFSRGRK